METPLQTALGASTAKPLARLLGLETVGDLLRHYPRRYIDNRTPDGARGQGERLRLEAGQHITVLAVVRHVSQRRMRNRRGSITEVAIDTDAGPFTCTFFNQSWRERELRPGTRAVVSGDLKKYRDDWQLTVPEVQVVERDGEVTTLPALIPVYPATGKLRSWTIMLAVRQVLDVLDDPEDPVPPRIRERHGLAGLAGALRDVHMPDTHARQEAARRRLVWDEAFGLQLALVRRRAEAVTRPAPACPRRASGLAEAFDARLPFSLTDSQREVGSSLGDVLAGSEPLNRLLQGDVGSGKTLVALRAMLQVVDSGRQAVLLAPTEVLAVQHARSLRTLLGPLAAGGELSADPVAEHATTVTLLTGSLGARARRQALLDVQSGVAGLVVGTHAVIQQSVGFADLALVVVDEQHRFGVHQRDELRTRPGESTPHLLVMTATPIPRTVALTVYGDLDVSTLRELPAGRRPVTTNAVSTELERWMARVWERVREEVAAGHRAFVVCPRIGGDEAEPGAQEHPTGVADLAAPGDLLDADDDGPWIGPPPDGAPARERESTQTRPPLAVTEVGPLLAEGELAGLRLGVLHGRLPADEKDELMRAFAGGDLDVLVSTTVVEVGVDVPEATIMVVLDAERFGVSQLHQLRGRVGRGSAASSCFLVTDASPGSPALARLERVAATPDGFEVAAIDLEVRREGDVLGTDQSGRQSGLHMLSVLRHGDLIAEAREAARDLVERDPALADHPGAAALMRQVVGDGEAAAFLDRL